MRFFLGTATATATGFPKTNVQVWSRFVTVERDGRSLKAMAPVFDMFNHDPTSSTVHGFQETNQCLHLVTLQEWPSGSEVRFSYGPLPNSRLLLLHGFCLPDNVFDAVELWSMMEEQAPNYPAKSKARKFTATAVVVRVTARLAY